jgi:hypothetical protein
LFFVVEHEGKRHPHYGRFLMLEAFTIKSVQIITANPGSRFLSGSISG